MLQRYLILAVYLKVKESPEHLLWALIGLYLD